MSTSIGVNVSLEPQLLKALKTVRALIPNELAVKLRPYIDTDGKVASSIIPYDLVQGVSQWSRSTEGNTKLQERFINPADFSMISLLAGATTSPEKNFGEYTPVKAPEEVAFDRAKERKAITAVINGLFSVLGSGFAAWWGADKTGWKDEYKILFALFVGIVVAVSETALYLIWSSRKANGKKTRVRRDKKHDGDIGKPLPIEEPKVISTSTSKGEGQPTSIRQRR